MLKKLLLVFLLAFILNLAWEFAHSVLYTSYQGGEISPFILLRAAVWDGVFIAAIILLAILFKANKYIFVVASGLVLSIAIELWALQTGRWVYDAAMPTIPLLQTGLTPTIQLALTGCITVWYNFRASRN